MLQFFDVAFEGIKFFLINLSQFAPCLHLATIATNRNATLGSLHGIGVEIPLIRHTTQVVPDAETLFQPFLSCFQVGNVFRPFVA